MKNSKKSTSAPKYRSKKGELWEPPKGWLQSYRCAACHVIMTRKEASKCPQRINACGHITCAKCIVTSYLVELNQLCPVEECNKCVNPKQKKPTAPLEILTAASTPTPTTPPPESTTEVECCNWCGKNTLCDCNTEITKAHYCGDWLCPGDCGTLDCGCIDQCRGRCGFRGREFNWW